MAKRFTTKGAGTNGYVYEVNIYDDDYTGAVSEIVLSPDIIYETHGNDRDHFETIYTASATISVLLQSETEVGFIDDLINSNEARFYIELKFNEFDVFFGRIISNGISIEDRLRPFVTLQAIDGLTILKDLPYTHPVVNQFVRLKDIFIHILKQVDVFDKYYGPSDAILYIASKLTVDDPTMASNVIFDCVSYNDYFYTIENEDKVPLSNWDVLVELLNRHNMRMVYGNGIYKILGKEIQLSSNTLQEKLYYKDGSGITPIITFPTIDLLGTDTRALAGGTYYFEPGVKEVTISTDKRFNNKNLSDGKYWYHDDDTYQTLGFMLGDVRYQTFIRFSIFNYFLPSDYPEVKWVRVKMFFKAQEFGGSDIKYPKMSYNVAAGTEAHFYTIAPIYPIQELENGTSETAIVIYFRNINQLDYGLNFIFPEYNEDRVMSFRIEYDGLYDDFPDQPGFPWDENLIASWETIPLTYKLTQEFGQYPLLVSDVVKFRAETDTTEVVKKEIKILASDKYGSELTRPVLAKTGVGNNRSDDNWQFDSTDPQESLENAICRNILKYTANKQKFIDINLNVVSLIPDVTNNVTYRSEDFLVSKVRWNIYQATCQLTAIKIPDAEPAITVFSLVPVETPYQQTFIGYESEAYSTNLSIESYHQEFDNVTTDNVAIDSNLELFWSNEHSTNKRRWKVYMNGTKLKLIDPDTLLFPLSPGDLNVNQWTADVVNNTFYFAYELSGDHIEVEYIKI